MPSFDLTSKFWQIVMLKYACHHIFIYLYEFFIGLYRASGLLTQRINLALSNPKFHIIHLNSKLVKNKSIAHMLYSWRNHTEEEKMFIHYVDFPTFSYNSFFFSLFVSNCSCILSSAVKNFVILSLPTPVLVSYFFFAIPIKSIMLVM
jgi:hypothetical protein